MARKLEAGKDDLRSTHPAIAKTWHPTLNGGIYPDQVSAGTPKKFWWQCAFGHDWEASCASRKSGTGCPYCTNNRVLPGFNDLVTTHPELARSWHPTKNLPHSPSSILSGSQRKYWWICDQKHEWQASAGSRRSGTGCPTCRNLTVLPGYNDLATTNPELEGSWHTTLNLPETTKSIVAGSSKKRWWVCNAGHVYLSSPHNRTLGKGCPVCDGKVVESGSTDLASQYPKIAASWHPTKNLPKCSDEVSVGSSKKYWWICNLGHEWHASVAARTAKKSGCPICANQQLLPGFNDLATTNPELTPSWHPDKNLQAKPSTVVAGSSRKCWWICELGHEWEAAPHTRAKGVGCPYCSGRLVLSGFNDMATTYPELSKSWHPKKNLPFTPETVSAGTPQQFWWACPDGHEWRTAPAARSKAGTGCPRCANYGYDSTMPGTLYFIENDTYDAYKVGIMNSQSKRLKRFQDGGWRIIETWTNPSGSLIRDIETNFFKYLKHVMAVAPFVDAQTMGAKGGHSETFSRSETSKLEVMAILEKLLEEHTSN